MLNTLPSIHIIVHSPPRFLNKMALLAEQSESFTVDRQVYDPINNDLTVASFRCTASLLLRDLSVQLLIFPSDRCKVAVEVRSDDFPSYETYSASAKAIIGPLLTTYNREEHTRLRLTIQPKKKLEPKLPPQSAKLFKHFVAHANKSDLHLSDWRRFYEFARGCSISSKVSEIDITRLLVKEGFSERSALYIGDIYTHLCNFRRPRSPAEIYERLHLRKNST